MNIEELKQLIYQGEKVDVECKKAENSVPKSVYESYSAFANTNGGYIFLGVKEDKSATDLNERFIIQGVLNPEKQKEDFWNTINGSKVNRNILRDEDVYSLVDGDKTIIVIHVPRADYNMRPVYIGENPYKGTFKRNHEGDYHATEDEIRSMIRDHSIEGNDNMIIEYYTMNDIDKETLEKYRKIFEVRNPGHIWNSLSDKDFLEKLGGYRKDRKTSVEGLTLAGLMMFGTGQAIREKFDNILMDYRDETDATIDLRWNDRITYDGTWENNLFNFFTKVTPKLTEDIKKPFKLEGMQRIDDTPVHKAIREAFVNAIIHSDYLVDSGVLRVIKRKSSFEFTNPGTLKLPIDDIYQGGNSKSRNPHMQTMLRLVGYGDNVGSGFPTILDTWKKEGWEKPKLIEDTILNQVILTMNMTNDSTVSAPNLDESKDNKSADSSADSPKSADKSAESSADSPKSADKSAESSADSPKSAEYDLTENQRKILSFMLNDTEYGSDQIAEAIGLKGSRTRQLLNELVSMGKITYTTKTKKRRYIKVI